MTLSKAQFLQALQDNADAGDTGEREYRPITTAIIEGASYGIKGVVYNNDDIVIQRPPSRTPDVTQPSTTASIYPTPNVQQVGIIGDAWNWLDKGFFGGWLPGGSSPNVPFTDMPIAKIMPMILMMVMMSRGNGQNNMMLPLIIMMMMKDNSPLGTKQQLPKQGGYI